MKVPLVRIGITLALGSIVASVVRFYVAMGAAAADLNGDMPTTREGLRDWFVKDFLFQGSVPELLFWTGTAIAVGGIVVLALAPARARRAAIDPNAELRRAIQEFELEQHAAGLGRPPDEPGAGTR